MTDSDKNRNIDVILELLNISNNNLTECGKGIIEISVFGAGAVARAPACC